MNQDEMTVGDLVRTWRERAGLNVPQLAKMAGTSRQNIENLEKNKVRTPHWDMRPLSSLMGYARLDDLIALKPPPSDAPRLVEAAEIPRGVSVHIADDEIERAITFMVEAARDTEPGSREALAALVSALLRNPEQTEEIRKVLTFFMGTRLRRPLAAAESREQAPPKVGEEPAAAAPVVTFPQAGNRPPRQIASPWSKKRSAAGGAKRGKKKGS